MTRSIPPTGLRRTLIALAVLAILATVTRPASGQDADPVAEYIKPDSTLSAGLGVASGNGRDRARFGQYNGLRKEGAHGLLDIDFVRRDEPSGTWTSFEGRNLGLDSRELRFGQNKQGDWKYSAEYSQGVRHSPYTINTAMQGAGSTTPVLSLLATPGSGTDLELKIKRQSFSLGFEKWLAKGLLVEVNFRSEDRDGARLFGRGFTCPSVAAPAPACTAAATGVNQWALLMLPEAINSTTRQVEAKLNYSSGTLALNAGYYGSFFTNANGTVTPTVPGSLNNGLGSPTLLQPGLRAILQLPVALPPDNQAHQFYLAGTYGITPSMRATFKLGYTHATQSDDFAGKGLTGAPAGRSNYGGVVDTMLAQLGLSARPWPKLSLNANLRYEDRQDKSPLAPYNLEGANRFINGTYSLKKTAAKLEGSYQLPAGLRGTLGVDYEAMDRGQLSSPECIDLGDGSCLGDSVAGLSGLRAKTHETSWRAELRRSMSETLTGAISAVHSQRGGSSWLKPVSLPATGVIEANADPACKAPPAPALNTCIYNRTGIFPMIFMDRRRDKLRLSADWAASELLSLQFAAEDGRDRYRAPTTKGLQDTQASLFSVDAVWSLSDAWKLSGYASQGVQTLHIAQGNLGYMADLKNTNTAVGLGLQGKISSKLEVAADLSYSDDLNRYGLAVDQGVAPLTAANLTTLANNTAQAAIGLPDVRYRLAQLKLSGKYALQKNSALQVELVHQRSTLREWTWGFDGVPFAYSDGTTVSQQPRQQVTAIGLRDVYTWQ